MPSAAADSDADNSHNMSGYAKTVGIDAPTSDIFDCAGVLANEAGKCSVARGSRRLVTR
ncbi:hypothetical protein [Streptomyces sp. NPDC059455]|uniref:hypothetical protein n=1 Tax=Streptomyces sp. NPDC059455 TaxID=3346837 RepID=UPI00369772AD